MSNRYKGGVISATPPTLVAGAGASGTWTLEQQMQANAAGLWPVNGPFYIEDVFSTYLYTGNGSTQTITNGIDLTTYGGLVWSKCRSSDLGGNGIHTLIDTVRGAGYRISSELTGAQVYNDNTVTGFSSTGFSIGNSPINNTSSATFVSWTFRKQAKFFDVVTYTGAGSGTTVSHNLGSTPGCVIVKATSGVDGWFVYHRDLLSAPPTNRYLRLDKTDATAFLSNWISVSDTTITFPTAYGPTASGGTSYVAYLFAHDAGGFGLTGTDNVISCGTFAANNGEVINLGYEPQWLLYKDSSSTSNWRIADTMRGFTNLSGTNAQTIKQLSPNTSSAESDNSGPVLTSTGFTWNQSGGGNVHIYIAIRRGPMKVPTSGTSVFSPVAETPSGSANYVMNSSSGFPVDMLLYKARNNVATPYLTNRLTNNYLQTASTAAEASFTYGYDLMQGVRGQFDATSQVDYAFRRAPSFFDEVCYTGNGSTQNITHNLGVAPEFLIVKPRNSSAYDWNCYHVSLGNTKYIALNTTLAASSAVSLWNNTTPTSTVFTVNHPAVNDSGGTYVAYLFATCAGVSKVGSYTGTGALQTVNCGFAAGARFVLIKRTDSTGDWFVWDSARGISSGNDPYLLLNSAAAEVTGTNYVDTTAVGFQVTAAAPAGLNANGGTFIFLAIA